MLPPINGKSLLDCDENDLEEIIGNPDFRESQDIDDYKDQFPIDKTPKGLARQKAIEELRSDVCAFANAGEGYLVFGVKDDGKGCAEELSGIDIDNIDKWELNLKTYLGSIEPRSPYVEINPVKLKNGKYIVVLFVRHDFFAPYIHLVEQKDYKIYKRVRNSKGSITYAELKNMFTQSISLEREVEKFRKERIDFFRSQEDNETYDYSKFLLFHIIPETFLDSSYNNPRFVLEKKGHSFGSIFSRFASCPYSQPTIEGLKFVKKYYINIDDNSECRIYNNGIAECFVPLTKTNGLFYGVDENNSPHYYDDAVWEDIEKTLKGMTQKFLGLQVGFTERTADIRMAQYESGSRTPKADVVEQLADALDVSTEALNVPNIDSYTGLMHTLFALEDLYGFKIDRLDGEICIRINRQNGSTFAKMTGLLEPWEEMAQKYRNGEISREEYDQWRYRYPRSEAERNEAERIKKKGISENEV